MSTLSPQEEMIQLIKQCILHKDFSTAAECLTIYRQTFGEDDFFHTYHATLIPVSVIYIQSETDSAELCLDTMISTEFHKNMDLVVIHSENLIQEFCNFISTTTSQYFCFYDARHSYEKNRIAILLSLLEKFPPVDGIIHARNFVDENGAILAHPDFIYKETLDQKLFDGADLLNYSVINNINLYGDLSTIFLSASYAKQLALTKLPVPDSMQFVALLYQLLSPARITYTYLPLSSSVVTFVSDPSVLLSDYTKLLQCCHSQGIITQIPDSLTDFTATEHFVSCKKDITFFYTDMGEYYNLKPIADMASSRGYHVTFTSDIHQEAEIGIYCQHICYPENSKFSVILLHDLAQGHDRWPNLWDLERWNKFDLGIVPGQFWADLWSKCACQYYTNPRCGTYQLGYPKSDLTASSALLERANELKEQLHLKYDFSILYAPSWENDGKEDDFVKALSSLPVNLLIKQAHWNEKYSHIIQNIKEMRSLHEGKYDNVYYIEPEESIMTALKMCNLVVSDESSVMAEALMFDVTSIAVTDWLIPDTTPSRYASVPMNYVIKCKKSELRETVEKYIASPDTYQTVLENGKLIFSNAGQCCSDIMDAIEYFTASNPDVSKAFMNKRVTSRYSLCSLWN